MKRMEFLASSAEISQANRVESMRDEEKEFDRERCDVDHYSLVR